MAWCDYCVIKSVRWGLPLQAFVTVTCARRIEGRHVTCRSGSLWFGLVRYIQRHPSDQSQTRLNFFALGVKQLAPTLENRNGLEPPCCGWLLGVVAFCFRLEVWSVQFSTPVLGSPLEVPFILIFRQTFRLKKRKTRRTLNNTWVYHRFQEKQSFTRFKKNYLSICYHWT